jgi:hypothetical protein
MAASTAACRRPRPAWRALADELLNLIALHDASNIAAVIVEPFAGSAGVVIPPVGYLQRLREICTAEQHPADLRRGDHRLRSRIGRLDRGRRPSASRPTS